MADPVVPPPEPDSLDCALERNIAALREHEVTRMMALISAMAERLGVPVSASEIEELTRNVSPEAVLDAIEERR